MNGCSTDPRESTLERRRPGWPRGRGRWRVAPFCLALLTLAAASPARGAPAPQGGAIATDGAILEHLRNEEYDEAIALEEKIIAESPGTPAAAKAAFSIAGIYLNFVNDYRHASAAYKRVAEEYPDSPYVEDAYYRMALLSLKLGDVEETAEYLSNVKGTEGGSRDAVQAKAGFLLDWLNRGRNVFYFQNRDTLMATSLSFEFIFIVLWLLIGVIDKIHHLYKKKSFWIVFGVLIIVLAFKLSVQYALFELVENL